MTNNEKNNEEIKFLKGVFVDAFNEFFYEAYIHFYLNPQDISVSEESRKAYEYAREGALDRIRRKIPEKSEKEYNDILEECCLHEVVRTLKESRGKFDDFKASAEKLKKMAEKLPPVSETKPT